MTDENKAYAERLAVSPEQENFVASVAHSLRQADDYSDAVPLIAMSGNAVVGFLLLFPWLEDGQRVVTIVRLLVDARVQRRGFARLALKEGMASSLKRWPEVCRFQLSVLPENHAAQALYEGAGFSRTGDLSEDGEIIYTRSSNL